MRKLCMRTLCMPLALQQREVTRSTLVMKVEIFKAYVRML